MSKSLKPPLIARWLLKRMSYYDNRHSIYGDFEETYRKIADDKGTFRAKCWYWLQVLRSLPEYSKLVLFKGGIMFKNYLKITLRNIKRNKSFTIINVSGLASGIVSCLLILLFVQYEMSYDRFPEKADSIYRVALERTYPDRVRNWGWTATALADDVERELPEVVQATRILNEMGETLISYEDNSFKEDDVLYVETKFFDFFSVSLLSGDPETALLNPNSMVITRNAAEKYFGDEDPMGKTLLVRNWWADNTAHVITGIVEELPKQSHFHYDFLISYNSSRVSENSQWGYWQVFNYLLLQDGCDPAIVESKFHDMVAKYIGPLIVEEDNMQFEDFLAAGNAYRYFLQPLKDIHLESNGNITYVYIFSLIAVFIMIIACINFMNLSTARSENRAKEVGIRKALGSFRMQLITQFIFESVFLCFLSLTVALLLAELNLNLIISQTY
ncbi:ABC transporter permease [candidate division KSB1 bacterium]